MKKDKSNQYYVIFLALIVPIILFVLIYIKLSTTIVISDEIPIQDLLSFFIETYSLFISIILAIIVFKQEKKIKFLEESEYNTFIGIDSIESMKVFGDVIFSNMNTDSGLPVSKTYIENDITNYVCLDLSEKNTPSKNYLIPLRLISKNKLLLNYVKLTELSISEKRKKGTDLSSDKKYTFKTNLNNNYISFCTCDNSAISLAIGVFSDISQTVEQFELELYLELLDISGYTHNLQLKATVVIQDDYCFLISSKTTEL